MFPDPASRDRLKPAGLVVAGVGFLLSRYTVAASLSAGDLPAFVAGHAVFLVVGLALSTYGVALAVSTRSPSYVRTIVVWCLLGTASMGVVLGLTVVGVGEPLPGALLSRVLLGGAVGGVLTGIHSATTARHRRDLQRTTDSLTVLNRILRHEVLNKVNVVQGYTSLHDDPERALTTIDRNAAAIGDAIESVNVLTDADRSRERVDVADLLDEQVTAARERFPEADVRFVGAPDDSAVLATSHLPTAVDHLVENAVVHNGPSPTVRVGATAEEGVVTLSVTDDGPGMPAEAAALLERDGPPEYDDPTTGFGLAIIRLVAGQTGAGVKVTTARNDAARGPAGSAVADSGTGTTVTLTLPRATTAGEGWGVPTTRLADAVVASVVGGVLMSAVFYALTGGVAVIGALYGAATPAIGWMTHLFHSAVFAITFAGLAARPPFRRWGRSAVGCLALGVGFAAVLWLVAAGVVMPVWLGLVGVPAPVPNLSPVGLLGHLVWGVAVGGSYFWLDARRNQ